MANKVFGTAIVREVNGAVSPSSSGAASVANQDLDYSKDWTEDKEEQSDGTLMSILAKRLEEKLTINVIPISGNFAGAAAAAVLPGENEVVTLSGFSIAVYNGTWNFKSGGKIKASKNKTAMMTYVLERYDGAALQPVNG